MTIYRRPDPLPLPTSAIPAAGGIAPLRQPDDDLHTRSVRRIFGSILAGHYGPTGALPSEGDLGAQLGVSRTVVREAIRTLASKGVLAAHRRRGTFVVDRSAWNLLDADLIRWLRDAEMAGDIASQLWRAVVCVLPAEAALCARRIRSEGLLALRDALQTLPASTGPASSERTVAVMREVFLTVADAAGNPFLRALVSRCLDGLSAGDQSFILGRAAQIRRSDYERLLAALTAGDPEAARACMTGLLEPATKAVAAL